MRIALYGKNTEKLECMKNFIRKRLEEKDIEANIDLYTEKSMLKADLFQYDAIGLNEKFLEMLECKKSKRITFSWGKKIKNCYVDDIYYAEADLKNVHIRFSDGEMLVHLPFSQVEQILEGEFFIKIHRSYLVNCCYIQNLDGDSVYLKNGVTLPVSKYRSAEVHEKYLEYLEKTKLPGMDVF